MATIEETVSEKIGDLGIRDRDVQPNLREVFLVLAQAIDAALAALAASQPPPASPPAP